MGHPGVSLLSVILRAAFFVGRRTYGVVGSGGGDGRQQVPRLRMTVLRTLMLRSG